MLTTATVLFLRRELPSRQTLILTFACLLPAAIALLTRVFGRGKEFLETAGASLTLLYSAVLIPIFYAVSAFHEEFESRSIVYLLTRPPSRRTYVVAKFLTAWACSALSLTSGIVVLTAVCAWGREELPYYFGIAAKLEVTAVLMAGLYSSFFLIFGLLFKNPVVMGLLFTLGWEYVVGLAPGRLQFWTLGIYPKSIFVNWAEADPKPFFPAAFREAAESAPPGFAAAGRALLAADMELPSLATGVAATVAITAASLWIAAIVFQRRDNA